MNFTFDYSWSLFPNQLVLRNFTQTTECVTDLDQQTKMIIFGQFLPFLNRAVFLEAAGAIMKIRLSLKANHHWEN
jgi:hypothetical protein